MNILHIASFSGNIGDIANHCGFQNNFKKLIDKNAYFTQCEIRKFYKSWNELYFDDQFADWANSFDLVVFGGGNFFEVCWDYSATGTTIDINNEVLAKLEVPLFFNGLGFDNSKYYSEATLKKFQQFIDSLLSRKSTTQISFRNDGSMKLFEQQYGSGYSSEISVVPDGGFFYDLNKSKEYQNKLCICLAKDMTVERYGSEAAETTFANKFSSWCTDFLNNNNEFELCFVPHIYSDLEIISQVVSAMPDKYRRNNVTVAPLRTRYSDLDHLAFSEYSDAKLVLSMRFHGNVVPIGNNIPTIGIITRPKHGYLYDEIGQSQRALHITDSGFWDDLTQLVYETLKNPNEVSHNYYFVNKYLKTSLEDYYSTLKKCLRQ